VEEVLARRIAKDEVGDRHLEGLGQLGERRHGRHDEAALEFADVATPQARFLDECVEGPVLLFAQPAHALADGPCQGIWLGPVSGLLRAWPRGHARLTVLSALLGWVRVPELASGIRRSRGRRAEGRIMTKRDEVRAQLRTATPPEDAAPKVLRVELGSGANITLVRRLAIAALIPMLLAACGGGEAENAPSATAASVARATPSAAVTGLKLYVTTPMRTSLATAIAAWLQTALVAAGYDLVTSEAAQHDLTARLAVSATQEQGFFHVTVNGRRQVTLKVHVALTIVGGAGVVDEVAHDFESSNGEVSDGNVSPLVARLNSSPRLARYASDQSNARRAKVEAERAAAVQAQDQAAHAEQDRAREQEETDWVHAGPLGCRMP